MKFIKVLIPFFFFISVAASLFAQTSKEDLEKKRDDLMKEIQSLQSELNQTKNSKKTNLDLAASLQKKIKAREKLIGNYNSEISILNKEISSKTQTVIALDKDLDQLKDNYGKMVYYAYKHRSAYDRLLFLFSAKDFNDAFQRLKYIKRYNAYRRQQAELIQSTQTDLKKQMSGLRVRKQGRQKLLTEQQLQ